MLNITSASHIIYYVRSLEESERFYRELLGFVRVDSLGAGSSFLRAPGSENHFDVGLIAVGDDAAPLPVRPRVGVYHMAWRVRTLPEFVAAHDLLERAEVLVGTADHGTHLSLYLEDPDENELEVAWELPREKWAERGFKIAPLDLPSLRGAATGAPFASTNTNSTTS